MTLAQYLGGEETLRPRELAYGVVREPPAPSVEHQIVVGRIFSLLDRHVRRYRAGRVIVSPVDVVLDREGALVVQPDVVFVSNARMAICHGRVWGAPDLVVEVLSAATRLHDRTVKLGWFRKYDVRECWLVDPLDRRIELLNLAAGTSRVFDEDEGVQSAVLPRLRLRPNSAFGY